MKFTLKKWQWLALAVALVVAYFVMSPAVTGATGACPGSQYYCPGVGCVSGKDKCNPGARGGPSAVFSKETFESQCKSMKPCRGGTRTDGPCLMDF